jgi:CheY-like chemotaxis protein
MAKKSTPGRKSKAILVVEDDIFLRMGAADFLIDSGFEVFEANSAEEAIVLTSGNRTPSAKALRPPAIFMAKPYSLPAVAKLMERC